MNTDAWKQKIGEEGVIPIVGDQLTIDCLMGLHKACGEENNGLDQLDVFIFMFGWFHTKMAFASSLHDQFMGTTLGHSLAHVFKALNQKGLQAAVNKGLFHHHLHEALLHVLEVHILSCWLKVSGNSKLVDLGSVPPAQLLAWARELEMCYASSDALVDLPPGSDDTFCVAVMFMRDTLIYLELYKAMRAGDPGQMEQVIPDLLYRFSGSCNPKYAILNIELIQSMQNEWPPEAK
jgi:hypothetical protein